MNLSSILDDNAGRIPASTAVICGEDGQVMTHADFLRAVNRFGNALLDLGVCKGDRVAIFLPNSPAYLIAYFATVRIGAIASPFNIMFRGPEIRYILNNGRAKVLVSALEETQERLPAIRPELSHLEHVVTVGGTTDGSLRFEDLIESHDDRLTAVDCDPNDPVTILYTSGTTGQPKGAMLTHGNWFANARLNATWVNFMNDQDVFFTGTPFCHVFFVQTVVAPFLVGGVVLTAKRFIAANAVKLMSDHRVTHFAGVPTMYIYMLQEYRPFFHDLGPWRFAQSAGASMPAEYIRKIEQTFGVGFCECYGSTESSGTVTFGRFGHGRPASIGRVAPGWQVRLVDEDGKDVAGKDVGELWIKGQGLLRAYWEMPEATAGAFAGEWFQTGDLGWRDEDGYLYLVDRKKDLVISGGYNVYPRELEDVLYTHPDVLEAAVIGLPDPARGEIPVAYIVPKPGQQASTEEIQGFCKERLAPYKVPRRVEMVSELPKGPTGKILKRVLKEQVLGR
ncbi:MAG TPA: long-chain-fatty-acid--CoA ligase [Spirochaetia bacterium]|nr:long-chain-fatty-acid--CoA ligase [Spirochaetia bacterium]